MINSAIKKQTKEQDILGFTCYQDFEHWLDKHLADKKGDLFTTSDDIEFYSHEEKIPVRPILHPQKTPVARFVDNILVGINNNVSATPSLKSIVQDLLNLGSRQITVYNGTKWKAFLTGESETPPKALAVHYVPFLNWDKKYNLSFWVVKTVDKGPFDQPLYCLIQQEPQKPEEQALHEMADQLADMLNILKLPNEKVQSYDARHLVV